MRSELVEAGTKLRRMDLVHLLALTTELTPLHEVVEGTVLEVLDCETKPSPFGPMTVLRCIDADEGREEKRIMAPDRFGDRTQYPGILVYLGKCVTKTKKGKTQPVHMLRRYGGVGDVFVSNVDMKVKAADLRARTLESLRALFSVKTFREMLVGAVLVYDTPRTHQSLRASTGNTEASWVVSFTTTVNDREESGEVYIPTRYAERLQQEPSGIIIYGAMR